MNENVRAGFNYIFGLLYAVEQKAIPGDELFFPSIIGEMLNFYRRYWHLSLDSVYEEAMFLIKKPEERLIMAAYEAFGRNLPEVALRLTESAIVISSELTYSAEYISFLVKNRNMELTRQFIGDFGERFPGNRYLEEKLFSCDVAEKFWSYDYYDLLADIQVNYRPRVYVEIGVATGKSLALARSETRALGIDPVSAEKSMLPYHSPQNSPSLFKMTSDDFFAYRDVPAEMGRAHFDVAFIDGLHHFDQALRDFINLERFAGPNSVILIHDCLPIDPRVATRERSTAFWTGDVWKIIPCLRTVRPDLDIITLPLSPAGLALVRRMDPNSRVLARQYVNVVEQFNAMELPESWEERCTLLAVEKDQSRFSLADYVPKGGWI